MRIIESVAEYRRLAGQDLGVSDWHRISQEQIDRFADATGDHQWIHVDPARSRAGPFGATIAHGYLTLSIIPTLTSQVLQVAGVRMGVNYGLNRVRFPSPVRVGERVRAAIKNLSIEDVAGGIQVVDSVTIEVDGQEKPACVAETVSRFYD